MKVRALFPLAAAAGMWLPSLVSAQEPARLPVAAAANPNQQLADAVATRLRGTDLVAGADVSITAQEFRLLKFFTQNPGRVISRTELLNEVWGYQDYPSTRTVDNHIWRLRLKLETDPGKPVHFQTVHGAGYKFVA